jgi:hypothetical protein
MYIPAWSLPRAVEIDKKWRDDARRLLREYGSTTQEPNPLPTVRFRSLAVRVEGDYEQAAESMPQRRAGSGTRSAVSGGCLT